jgi:histidinol-phosphate aminotransferase
MTVSPASYTPKHENLFADRWSHLGTVERKRVPPTPKDHHRLHRLERPEPWIELGDLITFTQPMGAINEYPDYAPFYDKLARFIGVTPKRIVVGAGIEDLIRNLFMLCIEPGDEVIYPWPTCKMFQVYAQVFRATPREIITDPQAPPTVADIVEQISRKTRLVILPNPGQPMENLFSRDDLMTLADACAEVAAVLAIDEAYYGFGAPTAQVIACSYDNVVVLRSFSKCFGGAGLRVGFAVGCRPIIGALDAVRQSGEISALSMHAAACMIDHWESHVEPGIKQVCAGRDWLRGQLTGRGFDSVGSVANHVLVNMGSAQDAHAMHDALIMHHGFHVRTNEEPLDGHLLITCGGVELMRRFMLAFKAEM